MSSGITTILIIVSFILILGGLALCGYFAYEELEKKNKKDIHIWYIVIGIVLVVLGIIGAVIFIRQLKVGKKAIMTGPESDEFKVGQTLPLTQGQYDPSQMPVPQDMGTGPDPYTGPSGPVPIPYQQQNLRMRSPMPYPRGGMYGSYGSPGTPQSYNMYGNYPMS
jgi:hypothetical protein